jgi:hypothetical protein
MLGHGFVQIAHRTTLSETLRIPSRKPVLAR